MKFCALLLVSLCIVASYGRIIREKRETEETEEVKDTVAENETDKVTEGITFLTDLFGLVAEKLPQNTNKEKNTPAEGFEFLSNLIGTVVEKIPKGRLEMINEFLDSLPEDEVAGRVGALPISMEALPASMHQITKLQALELVKEKVKEGLDSQKEG